MDLIEFLNSAISKNEEIEIIYYGGSKPGRKRKIIPRNINNDKCQALCRETGVVKSFLISKIGIDLNSSHIGADKSDFDEIELHTFDNIKDFLENYKTQLESFGWHIESDIETYLSLHGRFKNGTPKKNPDISIQYEEFYEDHIYDPDKDEFIIEVKKKQKPWCLRVKGQKTKNFTNLNKVFPSILKSAKELKVSK